MADVEGTGANLRKRFRDLEPAAVAADPNKAFAEYVSVAPAVPLGHQQVTVTTAAVALPSLPEGTKRVVIRPLSDPINFRDDGVDPTSTTGMYIFADELFVYDTEPTASFKMIRAADAADDVDVRIAYYG
jgi:hypothetical protein